MTKLRLLLTIALFSSACVPKMVKQSARSPDLFEKEGDKFTGNSRPIGANAPTELYVKSKDVTVIPLSSDVDTGSLVNLNAQNHFLATSKDPYTVGTIVKVEVKPTKKKTSSKDEAKKEPGKDQAKEKADDLDATEQEILKSLPELTPAEKGDPELAGFLPMQVVEKLANGDVMLAGERRSTSPSEARIVTYRAVLPAARALPGSTISTSDLERVNFNETVDGETYLRESLVWEDDYSLRASGFTEAKSKGAQLLGEQRKQLAVASKKLEERIKAVSAERREALKVKDEYTQKQSASDARLAELEAKVKDQEAKDAANKEAEGAKEKDKEKVNAKK